MEPAEASFCELVRMCVHDGSSGVWEEMTRRVQPLFGRCAYRVAYEYGPVRPEEVEDIVQDALLKLAEPGCARLRKLPGDSDGAAIAYIKEMGINTARDYFRSRGASKRGHGLTAQFDEQVMERVATIAADTDIDRDILLRQIDRALQAGARERTVFWLYYRTGLTAKEIAALPSVGIGAKGVESLIFRLTKAVREYLGGEGKSALGAL